MENAGYMFAAFTIIWALLFGYVLTMRHRQRNLQREISSLKQAFKDRGVEQ